MYSLNGICYTKLFQTYLVLCYLLYNLYSHHFVIHAKRTKRWDYRELTHAPKQMSDNNMKLLSSKKFESRDLFESTLDSILIPRSPGTDGHKKVQKFIRKTMSTLEWTVENDEFTANTPLGRRTFTNIMATLNPNHCKRVILACHYDSKLNREKTFLGATDSAVPCALIIQLALTLDKYLKKSNSDTTLQLVFFDGEEAFVQWTNDDSLYGSRHLANKWSRSAYPKELKSRCANGTTGQPVRELDRIESLILLDLIGTQNPRFYSFYPNTKPLFNRIVEIEKKLNEMNLLETKASGKKTGYFNARQTFNYVEDDHMPFLRRNVPIVHVIATPFPAVWHRESDNRENLDFPTIRNVFKILQVFVAEYLHLNVD